MPKQLEINIIITTENHNLDINLKTTNNIRTKAF